MIFSYLLLLLFLIFINANDQYHLGVINHNIQWHIHCPQNNTRLLKPPLNDEPLISYQCSSASLPIDIVPIEIDFTFVCRSESRLIWIMVDVYQYNDWLWSKNSEKLNISIKLNQQIEIQDMTNEIKTYENRLIIINAFYIPFESLEIVFNQKIEIFIRINKCIFFITENSTWDEMIYQNCHLIQSKTLHVQSARCDFFPKLKPIEIDHFDDNTTNIPDFHVILSIDEQQTIETTTIVTRFPDYYGLFNEHYRKILSTLTIITRTSNLMTFIFIFTVIILILLIIFFIYTLCYHYHTRSIRKSSLLI